MDANNLRIILAIVGALVLLALYLWERRRSRPDVDEDLEEGDAEANKREPRLGTWMADYEDGVSEREERTKVTGRKWGFGLFGRGSDEESEQPEVPHKPDQSDLDLEPSPPSGFPKGPLILMLHVVSRGEPFDGAALVHAASRCGLEPGEMEIFHCMIGDGDHRQTLFSMANMVKPGTFPFGAMAEFQSPGVTLFSQLEGTHDDPGKMEELLGTAHSLADDLGGEIRDEKRRPLSEEAERQLRDRVMDFVEWRLSRPDSP